MTERTDVMADVVLDYAVPAAHLAPYVTTFYRFACPRDFDEVERADRAQFRFRLSAGAAHYIFADGSWQDAPFAHVVGPTSGAFRTCAEGPVLVFGMGLTAAGWEALIGSDASALLNRLLDAELAFGERIPAMRLRLAGCGAVAEMIDTIEPLLTELIAREHTATLGFVAAVEAWLESAASPDIDDLVAATGLSRRHVERRCNQLYGTPPKLLARKYRALRAAVALVKRGADIDALIADGFYDQSHMIREIKQFTGLTPRRMRDDPGMLAQMTIRERSALEGRVPMMVSRT